MAQEDQHECHDIYLAAYLSEAGCELKGRRKQGHRVFFIFTNVGGSIEGLREDFYSGRGKVVACRYAGAVKKFKELCHIDT
jgi:hypothetical protein